MEVLTTEVGQLEVTSEDIIRQMERIRLHAESVQDYVGANYAEEQAMIRADDALLFALVDSLGAILADARDLLGVDESTVIMDIIAMVKPADQPKNHLCPGCSVERLDESGYCCKCKRTFTIM